MNPRRRIATRLSTILVLIVAASGILLGLAVSRSGERLLIRESMQYLAQQSRAVSIRLQDTLDSVQRDVDFLVRSPAVNAVVNAMDSGRARSAQGNAAAQARERLQDVFAALLVNHPWYVQVRLISVSDGGMELVRVNQHDGRIERVPDTALQHKGERTYFQEAQNEPPDAVFWSRIDLNREYGRIAEPPQPVLRAGMTVPGRYGTPFGIVIINLDVRRVFDAAKAILPSDATLYIANQEGDYLYHPDPDKTFGFERGQRYLIQDDFTAAALAPAGNSGVGLEEVRPAGATEPVVAHLGRLPLMVKGGNDLLIGLTRPRTHILRDINHIRRLNAALVFPFILAGAVVVIWMVHMLISPLERVTREMSRYTPGRPPQLPEQARRDEIGQLALAFTQMAARIEQQISELETQGKRFKSLFEAVPDAVVIIDEDGTVEYCNPATERLFGHPASELIGQNVRMLMPEPYRGHHDGYLNRYLDGGEPHIIGIGRKVVGLHREGRTLSLYLSIGEFALKGRRKFTGILHDISTHAPEHRTS